MMDDKWVMQFKTASLRRMLLRWTREAWRLNDMPYRSMKEDARIPIIRGEASDIKAELIRRGGWVA